MNILLKIVGVVLAIVGFILTIKPNLVTTISESVTPYQMIEKRVIWGSLIGLGIFLMSSHHLESWKTGIFAFLSALTLGIIISRIIGLMMDGFYLKQLLWLATEIIFLVIFGLLYWKNK